MWILKKANYDFILVVSLPTIILAIKEAEIIHETIPSSGDVHPHRMPYYREVVDTSSIHHIHFAVKAERAACILFSEIPANSIDTNTNSDYAEVCIGVWANGKCTIRIGDLTSSVGTVETLDILNATKY